VSGLRWPEVRPIDHDMKAFERVWDNPKRRRGATVLAVECQRKHFLAGVYRIDGAPVYVANVSHPLLGIVEGFASEVRPALNSEVIDREQYVEFLDEMQPTVGESPLDVVPAWCTCRAWEIPRPWLRSQLDAGAKWVTPAD
jgi:hypothetical protein